MMNSLSLRNDYFDNVKTSKSKIELIVAVVLMAGFIEMTVEAIFSAIHFYFLLSIIRYIDVIIYLFSFPVLICESYKLKENVCKKSLLKVSFLFFLLLVLFLLFSAKNTFIVSTFISSHVRILFVAPIFFFCSLLPFNSNKLIRYLSVGIWLSVLYSVLSVFLLNTDYMTFSYNILVYSMISYHLFSTTKKKKYLFAFLILAGFITVAGSRGAAACLVAFFLTHIFFFGKISSAKKTLIVIITGSLFLAVLVFSEQIFGILSRLFPNSRSIEMLKEGTITNDSYRFDIWRFLFTQLKASPFQMRGFYADREIIYKTFAGTNDLGHWIGTDSYHYAHNIFAELLFDFGIILGGFFCLIILRILFAFISRAHKRKDSLSAIMLIIAFSFFLPLCFSSSFLLSVEFWFFLGFISKIHKREKITVDCPIRQTKRYL